MFDEEDVYDDGNGSVDDVSDVQDDGVFYDYCDDYCDDDDCDDDVCDNDVCDNYCDDYCDDDGDDYCDDDAMMMTKHAWQGILALPCATLSSVYKTPPRCADGSTAVCRIRYTSLMKCTKNLLAPLHPFLIFNMSSSLEPWCL